MPTSPIPTWSANLAVNIPKDERALLGRLAARLGKRSVGELVRGYIAQGVEKDDAKSAADLRQIRRQYYGAALLFVFGLGFAVSLADHHGFERACRRVPRRGGWAFEECAVVESEESV